MEGFKNRGYNNIELTELLFQLTGVELSTILAEDPDTMFILRNTPQDVANYDIHTDYNINDILSKINSNTNSISVNISLDDNNTNACLYKQFFRNGIDEEYGFTKLIGFAATLTMNGFVFECRIVFNKYDEHPENDNIGISITLIKANE